jgi:regulator of nonsense transcripts 1
VFLACRTPCQFDPSVASRNVDNDHFRPLVSKGEIIADLVRVPTPDEFHTVSMARVISVNRAIHEQLGEADPAATSAVAVRLTPAKLEYDSTDEFISIMKPFITQEQADSQAGTTRRFSNISVTWRNRHSCSFVAPQALCRSLSIGVFLLVTVGEISEPAHVAHMSRNVHVDLKFQTDSRLFESRTVAIGVEFNDLPFRRQQLALEAFPKRHAMHPFLVRCILGQVSDQVWFQENNRFTDQFNFTVPPAQYFAPLNASQVKAVRTALGSRFTLIQGPPGTGKTTVIAALALSLVESGVKPVLVCSQSNVATDHATLRIAETGVRVVRVLSSTREQVDSSVDQFTTKTIARRKNAAEFERSQSDPKALTRLEGRIVNRGDVVCTTCVSAGGARLRGTRFPAVIFDESGQCLDPDILIGLVQGAEQVALVGDHQQLGPIITSQACKRAKYDLPIMQRLILIGIRPVILKFQYRMHPVLSAFPSRAFYRGLVQNGVNEAARTWPKRWIDWPRPDAPLLFWNVKSEEEYSETGLSYVNRHEAGCIAVLLDRMAQAGIAAAEIGVITPYAGQQAFLVDRLPGICNIADQTFFEQLEVASVDAFQGREKNFIILSNVRANEACDIGFLKDRRRLCVSLTRARYGMIVIGHAPTFAKNKKWCGFIEYCKGLGVLVEGLINAFTPSAFEPLVAPEGAESDDDD